MSFLQSHVISTAMSLRLHLFRLLVKDFMKPVPLTVGLETTCSKLVTEMTRVHTGHVLVTKADGTLAGIITGQDVTTKIAFRVSPEMPVEHIFSSPVHTVVLEDYLYYAIALMRRYNILQMPVIDPNGKPVGIVTLNDAFARLSLPLMEQIDTLTVENTVRGLSTVKNAQIQLAEEMFAINVPAHEIQQLLTDINRDIYRRVVQNILVDMEYEGWGKPKVDFDVLVMGSGGRGENYLFPDQDNGFILEDYPDQEHISVDTFFIALAERMTSQLDAIGFPYCQGYVMASNPVWRKTISQWRLQTLRWSRKIHAFAARFMGIFLDFRAAYGKRLLTFTLREHVTEHVGKSKSFLRALYENDADYGTALGWFNRLILETTDIPHKGKGRLNVKLNGLMPLSNAVRLLAIVGGIHETSTLERIDKLVEKGLLQQEQKEYLFSAFENLTTLLLRQQIHEYRTGQPITNYIVPESLSRRDYELLIDSFNHIENLRTKVRLDFSSEVF